MVTSNKEEEHPSSGHTNENGKIILMKIGILLPKLFWPTVRKNCSSDQEKLLKFKAEGREFKSFQDS